ncbi:TnpV protein, partial [Ruthenibacterium lactatiformans]|uniref:TnpV protein n=1 Tax=Ruthenibacterium lactatiformans TaxID=1550024 RepID=UPI0039F48D04
MTYTTQNGVRYPDLMLEEPEAAPGKYGLLRLRYLEKSDPGQLNSLLLEGALNSHLAQIDRQVRGQVEQTMERLV